MLVKIAGFGKPGIGIPWPYMFMKFSGTGGTVFFYFRTGSILGWGGYDIGTLFLIGRFFGIILEGYDSWRSLICLDYESIL